MLDVIEHPSGLILSAKTFRPLWIFPWTCSVWRQAPFAACIATIAFRNRAAADSGHREVVSLLRGLEIAPDMSNLFTAVEDFAKSKPDSDVKSYRVYPGHEVEGKVKIQVSDNRDATSP